MAIFSLVYADEDLKYTFPTNALIMCPCNEISVKQPQFYAAQQQTKAIMMTKDLENK